MSCLRANPMTGEMIDGDVIFDAGFIRSWKQQYALLIGSTTAADGREQSDAAGRRRGHQPDPGLEDGLRPADRRQPPRDGRPPAATPTGWSPRSIPADQNLLAWQLARNAARGGRGSCQFQSGMQRDLALAAIALADWRGRQARHPAGRRGPATKPERGQEEGHRRKKPEPASPSRRTSCPRSSSARRSSTS